LAVGIAAIPAYTRVVRATVLGARESEYVVAARVGGAPDREVILRHVLPNVLPPIIVLATLATIGIASSIILGSTLSSPVLRAHADRASLDHLLGDGLRDALDPRLRHR
jgi:peptide/nickel transport system permease protein